MKSKLTLFFLLYVISRFHCYSAEPVKVQLLSAVDSIGENPSLVLGLYFDIDPKWKIYAPSGNLAMHLGYPPKVEWHYLNNIQDVKIHWPIANKEKWEQYESAIYQNKIIVPLTLTVQQLYTPIELDFTLHFLACAQTCLPISKHFNFNLSAGVGHETPHATEIYQAMVPQRLNFALMIVLAVIGGFILNFMPCVLPVLTLKLLSLTTHKDQEKFFKSALNIFSGIIFSFLMLALVTLGIRQLGIKIGWGFHFQNIYFLITLITIMVVFSLNLFGVFEFRLPAFMQRLVSFLPPEKDKTYGQDFLSGVLATVLSTPCSAPFLGTAVSYALAMGGVYILVIFLSLGVGFGLPYILMASLPIKAIPLPKPGMWMNRLRQLLGFGLLLTSFWLSSIVLKQTGLPPLFNFSPSEQHLKWQPLEVGAIENHVKAESIVVVDITADWCMICLYNENFVLNKAKLKKILQHPNIVLMKGDWTKKDEQIFNFLKKNERYGIPFNKIYGPHCPEGIILPELLSQKTVIETLEKCGLPPSA